MCESWSEPRKGSGIRKVNDVSDPQWKVIGASGFVGSSIVARLNAEGISADPIKAPRLATRATDPEIIIDEAS